MLQDLSDSAALWVTLLLSDRFLQVERLVAALTSWVKRYTSQRWEGGGDFGKEIIMSYFTILCGVRISASFVSAMIEKSVVGIFSLLIRLFRTLLRIYNVVLNRM